MLDATTSINASQVSNFTETSSAFLKTVDLLRLGIRSIVFQMHEFNNHPREVIEVYVCSLQSSRHVKPRRLSLTVLYRNLFSPPTHFELRTACFLFDAQSRAPVSLRQQRQQPRQPHFELPILSTSLSTFAAPQHHSFQNAGATYSSGMAHRKHTSS